MFLLIDIGNTNTHLGLGDDQRVFKSRSISTLHWQNKDITAQLKQFIGSHPVVAACFCSVVPKTTLAVHRAVERKLRLPLVQLTPQTVVGIGIDYPKPNRIGQDRLANAVAARHHFGAPSVVVDFGTAVTFDVVDAEGNYVGGIIAPGLNAMTDYLHEKTALLPRIQIREPRGWIGKNTREAMLLGAVNGYRGLVSALILPLKKHLGKRRLPVVATGGCAALIASRVPEITAVEPLLTLEGLRLVAGTQSAS